VAPRQPRARAFLRGLIRFVALIAVAGGAGVALGAGLSQLAGDETATPSVSDEPTSGSTVLTGVATSVAPNPAPPPPPPAAATTTAAGPLGQVNVRVLGAILHPAATADGKRRRRARLTMRVRAVNESGGAVTIAAPVLAVGSVRIRTDAAAETAATRLGELAAGETKAVTLRFELQGEATEKVTIDRRARVVIAGRALAFRLRIGSPVEPPEAGDAVP